ncbi:hypothetical protein OQA88_4493 [Cercophora sp. LCS_1]
MADHPHGGRGYPPRDNDPDQRQQDQQQQPQSNYPPLDDEDRRQPPAQPMTLPPLHHTVPGGYPPPPEPRYPGGYPAEQTRFSEYPQPPTDHRYSAQPSYGNDQRSWSSESPTNPNGYPPPGPGERGQLPPIRHPDDRARYDERRVMYDRPYEDRGRYEERRGYPEPPYYPGQPEPARGGYGPPPDPYYAYRGGYAYGPDYRQGGPPPAPPAPQPQAAPRQRTSIACRYCRKRKIRCSGYANTTNGKCTNCDKLRIDCVFQPVSSNSGTAFVPISAVPGGTGGLPPGTTLYGAYGQPLREVPIVSQSQSQAGQSQSQRPYGSDYAPSLHSPTSQYAPHDDREPSRRRARPSEEEHPHRLPPPNFPPDDDPRRRSPTNSNGTPPTAYHQYQPGYEQERIPTPHRNSPRNAAVIPTPSPSQQSQTPSSAPNNPMSLSAMVANDPRDRNKEGEPNGNGNGNASGSGSIDRDMLGRLNPPRRGQ